MSFDRPCGKKPCVDCTFLKGKSYLKPERAGDIAETVMNGSSFHCHKTVEHDEDGEGQITNKSLICAGSLIMMEKADPHTKGGNGCMANNQVRMAVRLGGYNPDDLDLTADVYESPEAMAEGHSA